MRVVGAVLERDPVLSTVFGAQDQVEHPDRITEFVVGEPDVEQRFVGALLNPPLAISGQHGPLFVVRFSHRQSCVMLEYQLADLAAVKLSGPGGAGIAAV
ncbi:hypothetical protein D3C84_543300 [compost metagenome]